MKTQAGLIRSRRFSTTCHVGLFVLETADPERLPLPSFELLQVRYVLQSVAALKGVRERDDESYYGGRILIS